MMNATGEVKMEMFVLIGDDGFGGDAVLGVYDSRESCLSVAKQYQSEVTEDDPSFDRYLVERRVVGARPQWGFLESFREVLFVVGEE